MNEKDKKSLNELKLQGSIFVSKSEKSIDIWKIIELLLDNRKIKSIFYFINDNRFDYFDDISNFKNYIKEILPLHSQFALVFEMKKYKYFRIDSYLDQVSFNCKFFLDNNLDYYLRILTTLNDLNCDIVSFSPDKDGGYKYGDSLYKTLKKNGITRIRNFGFSYAIFNTYSLDKIIKDGRYDPNKAKELETILLNAPMYSVEKISNNRLVFRMVENLQDLKQDLEYERVWMDCHQYFENELPKVMIDSNDIRYY